MVVFRELACVLCFVVLGKVDGHAIEDAMVRDPRAIDIDTENEVEPELQFYTRDMWGARPPLDTNKLRTPIPFVVIHHTYIPDACYNKESCFKAMRNIQDYHMDGRKWFDIGYNFCIGSDGGVYEGRGWTTLGAHSLHFNTISLGICLIGDWNANTPPENQMRITKELIKIGQDKGMIKEDYKLIGHRQVRSTDCPRNALFNEIQQWMHYSIFPKSSNDLLEVEELSEDIKAIIKNSTKF